MTLQQEFNFCFPLRELANDRVKLTPFQANRHAAKFFAVASQHPELYAYGASGPYDSEAHYVSAFLKGTSLKDPGMATFAVIDKTRPPSAEDDEGELAGTMSYMASSAAWLGTEIGHVLILPPYQRTHVATNAVGLMMQYALEPEAKGGLGLRRVQWRAHAKNAASIRLAERMGFRKEGIMLWHVRFEKGRLRFKVGNDKPLPPGSDPDDLWRDTIVLSHCWDTWEDGGRAVVEAAMNRTG
ncbi:hypothetical protein ACRALDRAFT_1052518 [Sodiomyces alcalophilus JCM 7366]|uniref:uncharacterized protein n=1 Tax=Sodiomyces alcalophilus JCM 7366 TaxID=591952 RepID=UPI0039B60F11